MTSPNATPEIEPAATPIREPRGLEIPAYRVTLSLAPGVQVAERPRVFSHIEAAPLVADYIGLIADREYMVALFLDVHSYVLALNTVAIGHATAVLTHPRELFRAAILAGAATIMLAHNHPSGHPGPSETDLLYTRNVHAVGELLRIPLVDHIVLGHSADDYVSLRAEGLAVLAWRDEARARDGRPQGPGAAHRRPRRPSATRGASLRAAAWACVHCHRRQLQRHRQCRYCYAFQPAS